MTVVYYFFRFSGLIGLNWALFSSHRCGLRSRWQFHVVESSARAWIPRRTSCPSEPLSTKAFIVQEASSRFLTAWQLASRWQCSKKTSSHVKVIIIPLLATQMAKANFGYPQSPRGRLYNSTKYQEMWFIGSHQCNTLLYSLYK